MTQNDAILKHLRRHKTITTIEAFKNHGICRLSERVRELKAAGKRIGGHMVRVKTRYGVTSVMQYYLAR
jgi:hypothetical protein